MCIFKWGLPVHVINISTVFIISSIRTTLKPSMLKGKYEKKKNNNNTLMLWLHSHYKNKSQIIVNYQSIINCWEPMSIVKDNPSFFS